MMISKSIKKVLLLHFNEDALPLKKLEKFFSRLGTACEIVMLDLRDYPPLSIAGRRVRRKKIGDYRTGEMEERARAVAHELTENLGKESFDDGVKLSEWIYEGVSVWEISKASIEIFLGSRLAKEIFYEQIIKSEQPDLVIPAGFCGKKHPYPAAPFLKMAHGMGIPVLEIESSLLSRAGKIFSSILSSLGARNFPLKENLPAAGPAGDGAEIFIVGCTSLSEIERMTSVLRQANPSAAIKIFIFEKAYLNLSRLKKILESGKAEVFLLSPEDAADPKLKELGFLLKKFRERFYKTSAAVCPVWEWFCAQFEGALKQVRNLKQVVALKPSLIVLQDENSIIRRMTSRLAQEAGIQTLFLPSYIEQFSGAFCKNVSSGASAGVWAVTGARVREKLISAGIHPERIAVTGLPGYKPSNGFREETGEEISGVILWTTQGFPEEELLWRAIFECMKEMPGHRLLIKKHPRYQKQRMPASGLRNVQIIETGSVETLIASSDMLITGNRSITAFEAIIRDKPVLIFNPFGRQTPYPFIDTGAALEVREPEEIQFKIRQILTDKALQSRLKQARQKIVDDYLPPPGVLPEEEIARLVRGAQAASHDSGLLAGSQQL